MALHNPTKAKSKKGQNLEAREFKVEQLQESFVLTCLNTKKNPKNPKNISKATTSMMYFEMLLYII